MTQNASVLAVRPINADGHQRALGWLCAGMTVLVWSGYFLSLRAGVLSPMGTLELSLIRFTLPGLLLLPVLWRAWSAIRRTPVLYSLGIVLGSGLGFFLLSVIAMQKTNVVLGSTLIPGTAPLFVSLIAVFAFGQALPWLRTVGLTFIAAGIIVFVWQASTQGALNQLHGIGLFLVSAFVWALFTVSVRQSGLKPLYVAALVAVPNGVLVGVWALASASTITFENVLPHQMLVQIIFQGLLVGIFSGLFYSTAISRLGAETTSAVGSATPLVASFGGWLWLGEAISPVAFGALFITALGVYIASQAKS